MVRFCFWFPKRETFRVRQGLPFNTDLFIVMSVNCNADKYTFQRSVITSWHSDSFLTTSHWLVCVIISISKPICHYALGTSFLKEGKTMFTSMVSSGNSL